ncbi:MAG: tryptophan-rich sensory protein [Candidatus Levybacteria bacterium]|nr:tryptophan-rich sensory protein [Candidatus Levybacteria bacterium]
MNTSKLIASLALCFFVAFAGNLITMPAIESWYPTLAKPSFTPPNWLFGPVWSLLYFMMGISFYLIWKKGDKDVKLRKALHVFLFQLFFNFLWTFVFFGLEQPLAGFIVIASLWISILYTIILFRKISQPAAYLLIPYLLWVTYASFLNLFIVLLN